MNIVKIKDEHIDSSVSFHDLFESSFRGKYVVCINWFYCIPIENHTNTDIIDLSLDASDDIPSDAIMFQDLLDANLVDIEETEKINDLNKYRKFNSFVSSELTSSQIKMFRTWLASTLLYFELEEDEDTILMLKYYKDSMYDGVIQVLSRFGKYTQDRVDENDKKCSCGCGQSLSIMSTTLPINICDPISIYRTNMHNKMVDVFSDTNFWLKYDKDFIKMFKLYIDNIIKMNLPFNNSNNTSMIVECSCDINSNTSQSLAMDQLRQLSQSLQYIIDDDIAGHKLYIYNSLMTFANNLYDYMQWD